MNGHQTIDVHAHAYPQASWGHRRKDDHAITEYGQPEPAGRSGRGGDLSSVIAALDAGRVDHALVLNLFEPLRVADDLADLPGRAGPEGNGPGAYLRWLNRWLCTATADQPRLHPVIAVDPVALGVMDVERHIADCQQLGAVGVKLHHSLQRIPPDDRRMWPLYGACAELRLPVIVHTGAELPAAAFAPVLAAWPSTTFVLAHAGGAAWRATPAVVSTHRNAFVDLAEIAWWCGSASAPTEGDLRWLINRLGSDRVLFGSDFPWYEPAAGVQLIRALGLSAGDEAAVLGGNAARAFKFPENTHPS